MLYSGSLHIGTCPCDECNNGISECNDRDCDQLAPDDELEENGGLCNRCHFGECADCGEYLVEGKITIGDGRYAEDYCKDCALFDEALPDKNGHLGDLDAGGLPAIQETLNV